MVTSQQVTSRESSETETHEGLVTRRLATLLVAIAVSGKEESDR